MNWNPAIGLPEAIALAAVFVAVALWLAWHGVREAAVVVRRLLLPLRTLGLAALAVLWLNPGRWLEES